MDKRRRKRRRSINPIVILAYVILAVVLVAAAFLIIKLITPDKTDRDKISTKKELNISTEASNQEANKTEEPKNEVPAVEENEREDEKENDDTTVDTSKEKEPVPTEEPVKREVVPLPIDDIFSPFACMVRKSDGAIIMDKNAFITCYPASMSKVLTAIVAIENVPDLNTPVTVFAEDIENAWLNDLSTAGFEAGETVTVKDLLYGILLRSGAECCEAITRAVTPSYDEYIAMMNNKAAEIGMVHSHFSNTSGCHSADHYTTAYDMCLLMDYAMKNQEFRNIIAADVYTSTATPVHPTGLIIASTVYGNMWLTDFPNGAHFLGGKTGTTDEAGQALVSAASYNGDEYYFVTSGDLTFGNLNFVDAITAYGMLTPQQ